MAFGVALRTWAGITHLPTDHLGSTSVASNASGALVARQTYFPYGAPRTSEGALPTDYTFTGQRVDASAGLMYYHARYYDAALGRFISADTIVPNPYNPQSLNRYSYVYNNPVKYTDPTGHCPLCVAAIVYAKVVIINAAVDTAIDFGIAQLTGEKFNLGQSLATNLAIDAVTAGVGGKIAKGGKIAGLVAKYGDEAGEIARRAIPLGFKDADEFAEFSVHLKDGLKQAGYDDVQAFFRGSSVTGESFKTGALFDVGRVSDYDLALVGPKLLQRAKDLGIDLRSGGTRTGPLTRRQLEKLGLWDLARELSELTNRDVSFMIYESVEAVLERGPALAVPW